MANEIEKPTTPEITKEKSYGWDPQAMIEITGLEYSILQKTIAFPHELASLFAPASATVQQIFTRMMEKGIAKEQVPQVTEQEVAPQGIPEPSPKLESPIDDMN